MQQVCPSQRNVLVEGVNHIRGGHKQTMESNTSWPRAASLYVCVCTHTVCVCSADSDTKTQGVSNVAACLCMCTKYLHSWTHLHCLERQCPCAPTSQTLIHPCQSSSLPTIQLTSSDPPLATSWQMEMRCGSWIRTTRSFLGQRRLAMISSS